MAVNDMQYPLVVILVLNWNGYQDTLACLHSLEKLTYPARRVIVIDNGSTDRSVAELRNAFPNLTLIETHANLGYGAGNNVGIRAALAQGAEYVWVLNNDTVSDPQALTTMVDVAEADARIGAVGSVLFYLADPQRVQVWGGGAVNTWIGVAKHHHQPVAGNRLHFLTGASLLLRAQVLRDIGPFDERYFLYWEDVDLCFRLRHAGWKLTVASASRLLHKEGGSLTPHDPRIKKYYDDSARTFLQRHSPFPFLPLLLRRTARLKRALAFLWQTRIYNSRN